MKVRIGFVSNSSSTSFVITNLTNEKKSIADFVKENPQLINQFNDEYSYEYSFDEALESAKNNYDEILTPNGETLVVFGDCQGTVLGVIFDYILRDGGESKSFKWRFNEYYR